MTKSGAKETAGALGYEQDEIPNTFVDDDYDDWREWWDSSIGLPNLALAPRAGVLRQE